MKNKKRDDISGKDIQKMIELKEELKKTSRILIFFCVLIVMISFTILVKIGDKLTFDIEDPIEVQKIKVGGLDKIEPMPKNVKYLCDEGVVVTELNCSSCQWWAEGSGFCYYLEEVRE
jgi:hypothetical protein